MTLFNLNSATDMSLRRRGRVDDFALLGDIAIVNHLHKLLNFECTVKLLTQIGDDEKSTGDSATEKILRIMSRDTDDRTTMERESDQWHVHAELRLQHDRVRMNSKSTDKAICKSSHWDSKIICVSESARWEESQIGNDTFNRKNRNKFSNFVQISMKSYFWKKKSRFSLMEDWHLDVDITLRLLMTLWFSEGYVSSWNLYVKDTSRPISSDWKTQIKKQ